jgi:putative oxidoreductase
MAVNALSTKSVPSLDWAYALGRVLLALLFLWSGYGKLANVAGTAGYMKAQGMPLADVLVWIALLVELIGSAMLVLGYKVRWAAAALIGFTLVATFVFHAYWAVPPEQAMGQQINFMKNIAISGGLLALFAHGSGRYAIERS